MAQTEQVGRGGRRAQGCRLSSPTPPLKCAPSCAASEPPATGTRAFHVKPLAVAVAGVGLLRDPFGALAGLPHDVVALPLADDRFRRGLLVARLDDELRRVGADALVLLGRDRQLVDAVAVTAFADDVHEPVADRRETAVEVLDALVHLAEERLVAPDPLYPLYPLLVCHGR